ncbi:hypothetical protein [Devosia crocina]|uniref:hypothetical protein n=1 Tax=Devosia crocina TaxID=429728 RepID=UPI003CC79D50
MTKLQQARRFFIVRTKGVRDHPVQDSAEASSDLVVIERDELRRIFVATNPGKDEANAAIAKSVCCMSMVQLTQAQAKWRQARLKGQADLLNPFF